MLCHRGHNITLNCSCQRHVFDYCLFFYLCLYLLSFWAQINVSKADIKFPVIRKKRFIIVYLLRIDMLCCLLRILFFSDDLLKRFIAGPYFSIVLLISCMSGQWGCGRRTLFVEAKTSFAELKMFNLWTNAVTQHWN